MTPKPRALLITPVLPLPTGSGRSIRAWAWLMDMKRTHDVRVVVCAPEPPPASDPSVRFVAAHVPIETRWRRAAALLLPFLALRPGFATDWPQIDDEDFDRAVADHNPDRIVVFRLYLHDIATAAARRFPDARLEIDLDDLESRTRRSVAGALLRLGRPLRAAREFALSLQYAVAERFLMARYHAIHLAAPDDMPLLCGKAALFPNRVGRPATAVAPSRSRLLFTGTLNYPPNEEAARFLIAELAPALAASPRLQLCIAGRNATPQLRSLLAMHPEIEFIDGAEDLVPCFATALAVLVPLRAGGGTKLKTIEAFACALPVVSTREGVRGLGAQAGEHYLPAETPRQFADAIARIAGDPALAARLGENGQSLWQQRFTLS